VHGQGTVRVELLITSIARKRIGIHVRALVDSQCVAAGETQSALITTEGPLTRMHASMNGEVTVASETLPALLASKWLFAIVGATMTREAELG
jgi:hypothetical protein